MNIKDSMSIVRMYLEQYIGASPYIIIFAVSLIYLWAVCKDKRKAIVYPIILMGVLIVNPLLYTYVWQKLFKTTYWRIFWTLPMIPVIAYALVDLTRRCKYVVVKIGVLAAAVLFLGLKGNYVYGEGVFTGTGNYYKLPDAAVAVAEALLELEEEPRVVVPSSLYCYLRQYSGRIKMMYGRNADGYVGGLAWDERRVFKQMSQEQPFMGRVAWLARENEYPYIVLHENQLVDQAEMTEYGYQWIKAVAGYHIYQDVWEEDKNYWTIKKYWNSDTQEAFVAMTDVYHRLAMIDGGSWENGSYVRQTMGLLGNQAECWLVSGLQPRMSGAYFNITNDLQDVRYWQAVWPDIVREENYKELVDDGNDETDSWAEAVGYCYQSYIERHYNIDCVGDEEADHILDMKLEIYQIPQIDEDELLENQMYAYRLVGKENSILYVPNVTEQRLQQFAEQHKDSLGSDYLIVSCLKKEIPEELERVVSAEQIVSLKDAEEEELYLR